MKRITAIALLGRGTPLALVPTLTLFGVTTAATVCGPSPAQASPAGQLSGHYIEWGTNRANGMTRTNQWYFTPCGDGCAQVDTCQTVARDDCNTGRATLINDRWEMDVARVNVACPNGQLIRGGARFHYSWDANTLVGTGQGALNGPGCPGLVTPDTTTIDLRLAPAS